MALSLIRLRNILSYGPCRQDLALGPLNVLIGPNGAGKSNLIEVLALVKHMRSSFWRVLLDGGGPEEWLWQGPDNAGTGPAEIELVADVPPHETARALVYRLAFGRGGIESEHLHAGHEPGPGPERLPVMLVGRSSEETSVFLTAGEAHDASRTLRKISVGHQDPVASHFRDPVLLPELADLSDALGSISLHRDWSFGRDIAMRRPQKADHSSAFPAETLDNLGLVLNRLGADRDARQRLVEALTRLYEGVTDYEVHIEFGHVQVFLREGRRLVPATRLAGRRAPLSLAAGHPLPSRTPLARVPGRARNSGCIRTFCRASQISFERRPSAAN